MLKYVRSVAVRIRDTGIGISKDLLMRIWDLFAQANQSLDRLQGGLGVGLTIICWLVESCTAAASKRTAMALDGALNSLLSFRCFRRRCPKQFSSQPTALRGAAFAFYWSKIIPMLRRA